jgi:hypothetical protein
MRKALHKETERREGKDLKKVFKDAGNILRKVPRKAFVNIVITSREEG